MDTDKPVIKVMAEYESFPLWQRDSSGTANVDPTTLPISPVLAEELLRWADAFDGTLNRSDPANSGFPDPGAEDDFYEQGQRLARRLVDDLAGRYAIEFFDGRDGQIHPVT
ncbi:MAG: hypothetical protein JWP76_3645 [Dactylosporangium sp.]|nr:hypothetical protein [Dactylosporangium sp.]